MSVLNPESGRDFIIKKNKVRELIMDAEIGEDTMKEINTRVVQLLLQAYDRTRANKRKRMFPCDL